MELEKKKSDLKKKPLNAGFKELMDAGIPLQKAIFWEPVISFKNEPETALYNKITVSKPSRTANIYFTPHGVVAEQDGYCLIIPLSNVKYTVVL